MNLKKEKKVLLLAANQASKVLLNHFGKKEAFKEKPNKSLVGIADTEANKAIIKIIKKNFPNHGILSEETGLDDKKSDYQWIIDPLDGTHNFLRGIPFFGTSIALEYKKELVLGVMQFPVLRLAAVAEKGKGAFLNGKKLKVSDKKRIEYAFILFEYSSGSREETIGFLKKIINETFDARNFGSAIYHLLLVASGQCDCYVVFHTNPWDIAAGFLIVEEAGGKITDLNGSKYNLQKKEFIISNGKIHNKILKYVK